MAEPIQRWLSLSGICTTLGFSKGQIGHLVRIKALVTIGFGKDKRYLDPTPEYRERLRIGEALYGRLYPIPIDLNLTALLTLREMAQILGLTLKYMEKRVYQDKIPSVKAGMYNLYTVETVRDLLWRRSGRKRHKQLAPFVIYELIEWFRKETAAAEEEVPTDAQFQADELLKRKLTRMARMKSPERELAFKDFYEKVMLAKSVVGSAKPSSSESSLSSPLN